MADDGDGGDGGGYLDPRGDTPVGSTWATGNLSPNDPLVDWASNLRQDDLAKYVNDPDGHAQAMAQAGIPPPSDDAMDRIHQHNEAAGTPSRSMFGSSGPTGYTPQQQATRAQQEQQAQSIVGGVPRPNVLGFTDFPEQPGEQGSNPTVERLQKNWQQSGQAQPYPPGQDPGVPPVMRQGSTVPPAQPPVVVQPTPAQQGQPSSGVTPTTVRDRLRAAVQQGGGATPPAAATPAEAKPAKPSREGGEPPSGEHPLNGPNEAPAVPAREKKQDRAPAAPNTDADGTAADASTPEGQDKIKKAIGTLAETMRGVKAPEPLKPPAGFAPAPRGPLAAGAVSPAALMAALGRTQTGQVPASVMPVLRALGRG